MYNANDVVAFGFTGTQGKWTRDQSSAVLVAFHKMRAKGARYMRNGDCVGSDARAGKCWLEAGGEIILHPPAVRAKRAFLPATFEFPPKPYLARNKDIAAMSFALFATPQHNHEELRSGTWATIRHARKLAMPICIIWPSGKMSRENWPEDGLSTPTTGG